MVSSQSSTSGLRRRGQAEMHPSLMPFHFVVSTLPASVRLCVGVCAASIRVFEDREN